MSESPPVLQLRHTAGLPARERREGILESRWLTRASSSELFAPLLGTPVFRHSGASLEEEENRRFWGTCGCTWDFKGGDTCPMDGSPAIERLSPRRAVLLMAAWCRLSFDLTGPEDQGVVDRAEALFDLDVLYLWPEDVLGDLRLAYGRQLGLLPEHEGYLGMGSEGLAAYWRAAMNRTRDSNSDADWGPFLLAQCALWKMERGYGGHSGAAGSPAFSRELVYRNLDDFFVFGYCLDTGLSLVEFVRGMVGNVYRPADYLLPALRPDVPWLSLAEAAYANLALGGRLDPVGLLVLADALVDAGLREDHAITTSLRDGSLPRFRGYWALDSLLGIE